MKPLAAYIERGIGSPLWSLQRDIVQDLEAHRRVAVKACHASGKSYLAAQVALAFTQTRKDAYVFTTAPTHQQVKDVIWRELNAAHVRQTARLHLAGIPVSLGTCHQTTYAFGTSQASGRSSDRGVQLQGIHAPRILVIVDEAPGVSEEMYEAAESLIAGGDGRMLAIGNPTITSGWFYDAFTGPHADRWLHRTIGYQDTPNFRDDEPDVHGLINSEYVDHARAVHGEDSAFFQARCLGEFPGTADDALFSQAELDLAAAPKPAHDDDELVAGIDVAGAGGRGDETALCIMRGSNVVRIEGYRGSEPVAFVTGGLQAIAPLDAYARITYDHIGVGEYFGQMLYAAGCTQAEPARLAAQRADDYDQYASLRAEAWYRLREEIRAGRVGNLRDPETIRQLRGVRTTLSARGLADIESKAQAAKRGLASPDRADALVLCTRDTRLRIAF